jgi:hypothetical protein
VLHIKAYDKRKFAHDPPQEVMSKEPIDPPKQMEADDKRKKRGKHCHSKCGKGNEKKVKDHLSVLLRLIHHHARDTICHQYLAPLHRWTFGGVIALKRTTVLASR